VLQVTLSLTHRQAMACYPQDSVAIAHPLASSLWAPAYVSEEIGAMIVDGLRSFFRGAVAACLAFLLSYALAAAHVSVLPESLAAGSEAKLTFRVPVEREVATTGLEISFPEDLEALLFQPKPGWTYEVVRDSSGRITGVIWSGGRIRPGEFDEFTVLVRTPDRQRQLAFTIRQTYADGQVVTWEGDEGPVVTITAQAAQRPAGGSATGWLRWLPALLAWSAVLALGIVGAGRAWTRRGPRSGEERGDAG